MTKKTEYFCDLCSDKMGVGFGINWTGPGGGNRLHLITDTYNAKQLEHHICQRCVNQIEEELIPIDKTHNQGVVFS